jgi:hypothetical protein
VGGTGVGAGDGRGVRPKAIVRRLSISNCSAGLHFPSLRFIWDRSKVRIFFRLNTDPSFKPDSGKLGSLVFKTYSWGKGVEGVTVEINASRKSVP